MRIHLHEKINETGRTTHYHHKKVKEIIINKDGFIEIRHWNKIEGNYTYKIEDFRNIAIYDDGE